MNILTGDSYTEEEAARFLRRRDFWREPGAAHDPYATIARLAREYCWAPKIRTLEVCCGDGLASTYVREEFDPHHVAQSYGIDGSEHLLARAPYWLDTTQGDVHAAVWPDNIDIVLMPFCLYHVDPEMMFSRAEGVLNDNGIVVAAWMQPDSFPELFGNWLREADWWNTRLEWDEPNKHGLTKVSESECGYTVDTHNVAAYVQDSMWWKSGMEIPAVAPPARATARFGYGVWRKV